MLPEFGLSGKVAIVTGGGRGIGKAITLTLAEAGADVVVTGRTPETLEGVAEEVARLGRKCLAIPADVSISEQVDAVVAQAVAEMGKIDILVNNAGVHLHKAIVPLPDARAWQDETRMSDAEWQKLININLSGAFHCIRAVGPHMIKQNYGKIIVISSVLAFRGGRYNVIYGASKAGLVGLIKSLAQEWARYKINVNAIAPGLTPTELVQKEIEKEDVLQKHLRFIPLRRLADPREIGLAAVYLASPAADYMTGQVLVLDGGSIA
ncbi:SDR family NAD(P)-dependent oxidoreductase [Chloroflexota bacterium]